MEALLSLSLDDVAKKIVNEGSASAGPKSQQPPMGKDMMDMTLDSYATTLRTRRNVMSNVPPKGFLTKDAKMAPKGLLTKDATLQEHIDAAKGATDQRTGTFVLQRQQPNRAMLSFQKPPMTAQAFQQKGVFGRQKFYRMFSPNVAPVRASHPYMMPQMPMAHPRMLQYQDSMPPIRISRLNRDVDKRVSSSRVQIQLGRSAPTQRAAAPRPTVPISSVTKRAPLPKRVQRVRSVSSSVRRVTGTAVRKMRTVASPRKMRTIAASPARKVRAVAASPARKMRAPSYPTVKVSGIPSQFTRADILSAFGDHFDVHKVVMGATRGTALVSFKSVKDARRARDEYDGGELNDCVITVTFVQ